MNKYKISFICCLLAFSGALGAQEGLADKSRTVDLGFGVSHSELLSTASTMTITAEELQQTAASSLSEALYGRLLGLTATSRGGFVGDENVGADFSIRGNKTLSSNGILILVDGYERPIDRLSIAEVESVTVLKDAAALSMLGHEGANGAILVKTKRGSIGKTHIQAGYSHKFTFDPQTADMLDAYGYATALNRARANDGLSAAYSQAELDLFKSGADPQFYPNVDWKKQVYRNMGSENKADISVYGGSEKLRYFTIIDYTGSRGLLTNTSQKDYNSQLKYSKANIRANVDFDVTPTTHMAVDVLSIFLETSRPNDVSANGANWYIYKTPASAFPIHTSNGYWGGTEAYGDGNVAAKIQESGFMKTHQRQLWANAKIVQDLDFLIKGLSVQGNIAYDNSSITNEKRYKGHQYAYEYYAGAIGDKSNVKEVIMGNKEQNLKFDHWTDSQWRRFTGNVGLYYHTSFRKDDNFSASAAYGVKSTVLDGQNNTFNRANVTGTLHYDLKNKYIADITLAAVGSNRSYPAKWAFSPTIGLGWVFANSETSALSFGKIRVSGGIQHTDFVPEAGLWLSQWDGTNGSFFFGQANASQAGSFIKSFPTKDFDQERASSLNFGTELRLWNALDVTVDLYYQYRDHIMVAASDKNSWVVGIQSAYEDVGSVNSYGIESGLHFAKKLSRNLSLNTSALFGINRNKINFTIENPAYSNLATIGARVDEAWGLKAIGFFKDQADIDGSPRQEFSEVRPGDIKYADQNGDGVINEFDKVALGHGKSFPAVNFSFQFGMEFKGLGFNVLLQGAANQMKNLLSVDGVWNVLADNKNLSTNYYNNCWDVAGDAAKYPRLSSQNVVNNSQKSSVWYKNVSFLKLRNCEIYYRLPQSLLGKLRLSGAKLFVQGENLLCIDNVKAMDAEVLSTAYPMLKGVNLGLSLTF